MLIVTSALLRRSQGDVPEVLMGMKKTGFGAGMINCPGGKVEPGETPVEAAARELDEETGMTVDIAALVPAADVVFRFPDIPEWPDLRMYFFTATEFAGEPQETEEIAAAWVPEADIPWDRMWEDTQLWLPKVLAGEFVTMDFDYAGRDRVAHYVTVPPRAT
ncbi:MAG: 8-oxo-dGTP diphosphatase [Catenulispora sp.]|nr:8-oxo-dGTP diphosphatase [Catenulispora sp.]